MHSPPVLKPIPKLTYVAIPVSLLCIEIGDQLALHLFDKIPKHKFPFFQTAESQLVDIEISIKALDYVVKVAMLNAQLFEATPFCKYFCVDVVCHRFFILDLKARGGHETVMAEFRPAAASIFRCRQ